MSELKVIHIAAGDLTSGAAKGAYILHKSLLSIGVNSKFVLSGLSSEKDLISLSKLRHFRILHFFQRVFDSLPVRLYRKRKKVIFSTGFAGFDFTKLEEYKQADIVHLHWINNGFVSINKINKINKPIVWTVRDMWPMTGGCHVAKAINCDNYLSNCGNCPQLNSNSKFDLSRIVFEFKRIMYPAGIELVGLSRWICYEIERSPLLKKYRVTYIPNPIDDRSYSPIKKNIAKKALEIDTKKKIILVGAYSLDDFNKGFNLFLKAINFLNPDNYYISIFGEVDEKLIASSGFDYKIFGRQYDEISLKLIYSHADVFVSPSLMESFGKTIAESMSCGTPVVCFGTTGQLDIVDHEINGYCASPYEPKGLAEGVDWIAYHPDYNKIRFSAIQKVRKNFRKTDIAEKYLDLYKSLIRLEK